VRKSRTAYLFIAPSMIYAILFVLLPIGGVVILSGTDYNILRGNPSWVGIQNYLELVKDQRFLVSFRNTLTFMAGVIPTGMILSLLLAVGINAKIRGRGVFRTIYYLPQVTSFVAVGIVWHWIFEPRFGLANFILRKLGLSGLRWLTDPSTALFALMIVHVWKFLGYKMVIFLAGLQSIPESLYEASAIDGAGRVTQFVSITVPMLKPILFYVFATGCIGGFQIFDLIYVMTQGGPLNSTTTVVHQIFLNAFEYFNLGIASAMSLVLFAIILMLTIANFRLFGSVFRGGE